MLLLPTYVVNKEQGILYAQHRVAHAFRRGQKSVTLQKQGVQFCKDVEVAILQIVPKAKITGTVNKLFVKLQ